MQSPSLFVKEGTFLGPPLFPLAIGGRPILLDVFPPPLHFPSSLSLPGQFRKKLLFSPLQREKRRRGERRGYGGRGHRAFKIVLHQLPAFKKIIKKKTTLSQIWAKMEAKHGKEVCALLCAFLQVFQCKAAGP